MVREGLQPDRVIQLADFISEREQEMLVNWAHYCRDKMHVEETGKGRLTHDCTELPGQFQVEEVLRRIIKATFMYDADLYRYKLVIHPPGAFTRPHIDFGARYKAPMYLYRCNLLLQAADVGGVFKIEGEPVNMKERELTYYQGNRQHEVTPVVSGERILLRCLFGRGDIPSKGNHTIWPIYSPLEKTDDSSS